MKPEKDIGAMIQAAADAQVARLEAEGPRERRFNPNSATYWLPRITDALPTWIPLSLIVPYDHHKAVYQMEGESVYEGWPEVLARVGDAANTIGYPVFIRTDLASAKHGGPSDYLARCESDLPRVLFSTVEDNELKFWTEGGPEAFIVRQFLSLIAPFEAFCGLPIAREFRFFATHKEIICSHPYWPEGAIKFYRGSTETQGWKEALAKTHELPSNAEWQLLQTTAMRAVEACNLDVAWSVDFAQDVSGKWWLIDMAIAAQSWHWPDCPTIGKKST